MNKAPLALSLILFAGLVIVVIITASTFPEPKRVATGDTIKSLREKGKQALLFNKSKGYNTDFCILIDLSRHSGLKRFYLWDFKKDTIALSALVSHGCGKMPWSATWSKDKATLSNTDGSHCSSGGKYRLGKRGYSNWGININYQLHGLEKTNSNALKRQIVLHSWEKIPDEEVFPLGTPEGWGCPAISNQVLKSIDPKLRLSKKPVLMWIYN
ncbi:peptidase [Flavihumibacter sp. R14]|nr:peptidase [Flavihumibacter soli]